MWHEARRSEKKVHDMMDAARKRAQRRAVFLAKRRGDPMQSIQLIGNRSRMYRDDGLYQATNDQQGLYVTFFVKKCCCNLAIFFGNFVVTIN
jgi:arginine/serine-rich splicing factor 16